MTVSDDEWVSLISTCLSLLSDSDKLLASTVRCLGALSAGLTPWTPLHLRHLLVILESLFAKMSHNDSSVSVTGNTSVISNSSPSGRVRYNIVMLSTKVVYSLCQSISTIGLVLFWDGDGDKDGISPEVGQHISEIRIFLAEMVQYGANKVKLHAARSLIALCDKVDSVVSAEKDHDTTTGDGRSTSRVSLREVVQERRLSLLYALEATMRTAFEYVQDDDGAAVPGSLGALSRLLLVLLRTLLTRLPTPTRSSAEREETHGASQSLLLLQPVSDKLLFYQEEFIELLETATRDIVPYTKSELNACNIPLGVEPSYPALFEPNEASLCSPSQLAARLAQQALDIVSLRSDSSDTASANDDDRSAETSVDASRTPHMEFAREYGHTSFTVTCQERLHHLCRGGTVPCVGPPSKVSYIYGVHDVSSPPLDAARVSIQTAKSVLNSPNGSGGAKHGISIIASEDGGGTSTHTTSATGNDSEDDDEI